MYPLAKFVRLNAQRHPDRMAVVDSTTRRTHRELAERARLLANGLARAGVRPGDRVGVLAGNSVFAMETLLGTALAGAAWVPFNWRWSTEELVHGVNLVRPRVVLVEDQFAPAFAAAERSGEFEDAGLPSFGQRDGYEGLLVDEPAAPVSVALDDPLCILFTGGTTGRSKGVVLSNRAALSNALNEIVDLGFGQAPYNTAVSVTPLFHSAALLCIVVPHYLTGGTNVLLHKFDEKTFGDVVHDEGVNSTFLTPNMIRRLLAAGFFDRDDLGCFRQLHTGAGLFRMPDKQAVLSRMPDLQVFFRYGLTEAGPMVTRLTHGDMLDPALDGSIGKEYTFAEVTVRDENGEQVPDGELGEICVRGPSVMTGYFDRPDETAAAFRDGWLRTGDLAVRDAAGYFFFRDRAKDMIKSGGENVYAAEIEQLLYTHPAVMECGVLGVPSEEWDEEVRAVVALRDGASATEDDLRAFLREHLAGYKVPKKFLFVAPAQMPVNPSGKIVKSELRRIAGW